MATAAMANTASMAMANTVIKYGHYGKYGYGNYGNYGNYASSHYGKKEDNSIKK